MSDDLETATLTSPQPDRARVLPRVLRASLLFVVGIVVATTTIGFSARKATHTQLPLLATTAANQTIPFVVDKSSVNASSPSAFTHFDPTVGIVVPTSGPSSWKAQYLCGLIDSAAKWTQAKVYPVFSDELSVSAFETLYPDIPRMSRNISNLLELREFQVTVVVVSVPRGIFEPPYKKLMAAKLLFESTPAQHLVLVDDETLVRSRMHLEPDFHWYLRAREQQREVPIGSPRLEGNPRKPAKSIKEIKRNQAIKEVMRTSCAAIGLPSLAGYSWWADAPVFDAYDFFDFFQRINTSNIQRDFFDHVAYQCYGGGPVSFGAVLVLAQEGVRFRAQRHEADGGRKRAPRGRAERCCAQQGCCQERDTRSLSLRASEALEVDGDGERRNVRAREPRDGREGRRSCADEGACCRAQEGAAGEQGADASARARWPAACIDGDCPFEDAADDLHLLAG